MSDRIAVMNRRHRADRRARGGVRAPRHHVRRRLHRRLEPDAGHGHAGDRRPRHDPARHRPGGGNRGRRDRDRRALPRRRPAGEARDPTRERSGLLATGSRRRGRGRELVYLGTSTQIVVDLPGDVSMTVLCPNVNEAERARLPGGGAPVRLSWAPEHMHVVRESASRRRGRGETGAVNSRDATAPTAPRQEAMLRKPDSGPSRSARGCARAAAMLVAVLALAAASRSPPAAAAGSRAAAADGKVETVKVGKPSGDLDDLELAPLHRQAHGPGLREGDRRLGQVHRGRQRQPRVLRQAAAAAGQGRVRRPRHHRRHRLDGEEDVRPRLPRRTSTRTRSRTSRRTWSRPSSTRPSTPSRKYSVPVAERDDRSDRQQRTWPRRQVHLRPLRPQIQGQGRHAHRDARHGAAGHEVPGHRPAKATEEDWLNAIDKIRRRPTAGRSGGSPATTTSSDLRAATSTR